jgi:glyoxylase-like metal-dependent hydrolase (beta-lactamase superfamily II)
MQPISFYKEDCLFLFFKFGKLPMIITRTGKISHDLYMLASDAMPVYLLDGDKPALFDAGLAFLGDIYVQAIKEVLGSRTPVYCFLTHSHFDHCGSVSVLKTHFPGLKVVASEKTSQVIKRPNAVKLIRSLTRTARDMSRSRVDAGGDNNRFEPFDVDVVLHDTETIDISNDLTVKALDTPGHTWDCLSYYIPQKKILMCSEAAGVPDQTGDIVSDFLVDYDRYVESMKRLNNLDVEVLCLGHRFAFTANDAKEYIRKSMQSCEEFLKRAEACFTEEAGDLQSIIKRVKKFEYNDKPGPKQLEAAYTLNLEARIKVIQKRIENRTN